MLLSKRPFSGPKLSMMPPMGWSPNSPRLVFVQPFDNYVPPHVKTPKLPDMSEFFLEQKNIPRNNSFGKFKNREEIKCRELERPDQYGEEVKLEIPPNLEWRFEDIVEGLKNDIVKVVEQSMVHEQTENVEKFEEVALEDDFKENNSQDKIMLSNLFDRLLNDIYSNQGHAPHSKYLEPTRRKSELSYNQLYKESTDLHRHYSLPAQLGAQNNQLRKIDSLRVITREIDVEETFIDINHKTYSEEEINGFDRIQLESHIKFIKDEISSVGSCLVSELEEKDCLLSEQQGLCEIVTASLQAISKKTRDDAHVRFSLSPITTTDQSGFQEWARAMRMVARLPDGVPAHFRKNLWLSLAERHLNSKGISNWSQTEKKLFSDTTSAEDRELSVQIVKDLHRTGCSLFCGATGQHNQVVLKRVLLAYARWNKNVGYCQGLNMLAALILQVMQGSQSATVKVMIYLIEGVLPDGYFGNNLRGLSVDMAVFRDLLRLKLPDLSKHLDQLQQDSKDSGTNYEPPLCDVFTMQWFLTLFSNCLPQNTVLRVWDLVFLEGDQILLRTALAIWQSLSERMMAVRSADEFYSIMAVLTREMMEFGLMEPNSLIKAIDNMLTPEVIELREKYVYNVSPWAVGTVAKMGLKLFYDPYEGTSSGDDSKQEPRLTPYSNHPDREKIALDITALKRQYWKLRERQRQAHIILSACRNETLGSSSSQTLNHLLLGKRALLSAKGRRIEGAIPPNAQKAKKKIDTQSGQTLHWKDARRESMRSPSPSSSSSSSSTELCDSSDTDDSPPIEDCSQMEDDFETVFQRQTEPVFVESTQEVAPESIPEVSSSHDDVKPCIDVVEPKETETEEKKLPLNNIGRRKSEIALLQILQENSEILQRIQSNKSFEGTEQRFKNQLSLEEPRTLNVEHKVQTQKSFDERDLRPKRQDPFEEPDDIRDIRRRYERVLSLDEQIPPTNSLIQPYPFPTRSPKRNKEVGISLGLYSSDS